MFVPILFSFILFISLTVFFRKKINISFKPLIFGALGFVIFTQILEKIPHTIVVLNFPEYAKHPWLFGLYGGLTAGIFEEFGRYFLFKKILKKYRDYKDGIAFGIGWGGIEAVLLTLMIVVPNIIFAFMINTGTFDAQMTGKVPPETLSAMKDGVLNHTASFYIWGAVERLFAIFIQIAFSLFILFAVKNQKVSYVFYAVLFHAVIDFPVVFIQTGYIDHMWMVELYLAFISILSIVFIQKSVLFFNKNN